MTWMGRDHRRKGLSTHTFVVRFTTPDEAQRAIRERQHEVLGFSKVAITSFK
jgi:hypothetical protein